MSAKKVDRKNRWRNVNVSFRMSPEEAKVLNEYVRMSGLTKQDYLIRRVLHREVTVIEDPQSTARPALGNADGAEESGGRAEY